MIGSDERVFAALADSTRRQLLTTLAESGPKSATRLSQEFPITRQGILKHLDVLADAGLVRTQAKGREKMYWFTPRPLTHVNTWIETIGKQWDKRLQRLKILVEAERV